MIPFVAGLIEFGLCAMMFLMAAFAITGWTILTYMPTVHDPSAGIEFWMGILAIFAFVLTLAGSASAILRWSVLASVIGPALVTLWGLLENWYALTFLSALSDIQLSVTLGTIAIFSPMLVIIMILVSRQYFKPHALARASYE